MANGDRQRSGGSTVGTAILALHSRSLQTLGPPCETSKMKTTSRRDFISATSRAALAAAGGATVARPLPDSFKAVRYYGYHAMQTRTSFGNIRVTGE